MAKIKTNKDCITFVEFKHIKKECTLSFLPGGIVVYPFHKKGKVHYYPVTLDNNNQVKDEILVRIFGERGIVDECEFLYFSKERIYMEFQPHKRLSD